MLISGIAFVLAFWNYNYFDNFMVTRLYKLKRPNVDLESKQMSKEAAFT